MGSTFSNLYQKILTEHKFCDPQFDQVLMNVKNIQKYINLYFFVAFRIITV